MPARKGQSFTLPLNGPSGERVDFWATVTSHGCAALPPNQLDPVDRSLTLTLARKPGQTPRTLVLTARAPGRVRVEVMGRQPSAQEIVRLRAQTKYLLRLDEDLSEFQSLARHDPVIGSTAVASGRVLRSPTPFEDIVKTLCTTNCAWSATERMVGTLVRELGAVGPHGRAFPTPAAMAGARPGFYRDVVRAGYRAKYLRGLAETVAEGGIDLEALRAGSPLNDDEVLRRLVRLPGVGPYAAAHVMMLLGRYSRLILDSWTRPMFAARVGSRRLVPDAAIERRFRGYGRFAGLAFWLFVYGPEASPS
jgi:N-glycosylase/DNA lyase